MTAPLGALIAWLVHFGFAYSLHAWACARGWAASPLLGLPAVPLGVGVATVVAFAVAGTILFRARRRLRTASGEAERFLDRLAIGLALFAVLAIAFTALPIFLVSPCGG